MLNKALIHPGLRQLLNQRNHRFGEMVHGNKLNKLETTTTSNTVNTTSSSNGTTVRGRGKISRLSSKSLMMSRKTQELWQRQGLADLQPTLIQKWICKKLWEKPILARNHRLKLVKVGRVTVNFRTVRVKPNSWTNNFIAKAEFYLRIYVEGRSMSSFTNLQPIWKRKRQYRKNK